MNIVNIKNITLTVIGIAGSVLSALFGSFDAALATLMVFMGVDYVTGIIVAGVFHKSKKSEGGALESRAGWKGIFRKGMTLLIVLVAARLDILVGTCFIKDGVVIAYIANETLSIIENAGLMGIPIPDAINNAVEALKNRKDDNK